MITIDLSENAISFFNILITTIVALITAFLTSKYNAKPEKQITSRLIFDKCYTHIYSLVEYDLYSKTLTLQQVRDYGQDIIDICDQANNYFYPSIRVHAEWLRESNQENYQETWMYFSKRFSYRYDTVCKDIGIPLRNKAYRINRNHYHSNWELTRLALINDWPNALFMLILLLLLFSLLLNG